MASENKIEFIIPDKYLKDPTKEPAIGLIRYLREQGKNCQFLGFNEYPGELLGFTAWHNDYVVLIDGIKYYGSIGGNIETNYYVTFFVVNDEEHDYIENHLNKRTRQILDALEDRK